MNSLFLSRLEDVILHWVIISPGSSLVCDNFSDFPFCDLDSLKRTGQVFCRMPLSLGLSGASSWLDWDYTLLERIPQRWSARLTLYQGTWHEYDLSLMRRTLFTWLRVVCSARVPYRQATISPFPYLSCKWVTKSSSSWRRVIKLFFLEEEGFYILF